MAEKEIPWWARTIIYVAIPIGALVVVYKLISDWLMGPARAIEDLWKKQYEDYFKELKEYAEQDGGALTEEHQTILEGKRDAIRQTEKTWFQFVGTRDFWIGVLVTWGLSIASLFVAPAIIKKWRGLVKKGDVQSEQGAAYIAMCMMADDLAYRGYISEAAALTTTIQRRFEMVDKPFMQMQINYWQRLLPTLTGWELIYAQYVITAYQTTIAMVPIWISYLPPILRAGRVART